MRAIALKEFRQLRRDRRTLAMLFLLPFLFLVVFGYAASFDIKQVPTLVAGPQAELVAGALPEQFDAVDVRSSATEAQARDALRRGEAVVAIVLPAAADGAPRLLVDGTELFAAQAALRALAQLQAQATAGGAAGEAAGAAQPGAASPAGIHPRRHGAGPLRPRVPHRRHHDPGALRHHPGVRGHGGDGSRGGAGATGGHHGAARRHALPSARRLHRQDSALHGHRRPGHGDRGRRRHAALRRAVPRLRGHVRARGPSSCS